jgi:hypothetical protein
MEQDQPRFAPADSSLGDAEAIIIIRTTSGRSNAREKYFIASNMINENQTDSGAKIIPKSNPLNKE